MAGPLKYLLITVNVVALDKVSSLIYKVLTLFLTTLTVDEEYYLLNRDNLTQTIQMKLSQKQKTFSQFFFFFFAFLKSILYFKNLQKEDDPDS